METLLFRRISSIIKEKKFLEEKLNIALSISGKKITIEGDSLDEYEALMVLNALNFGFPLKTALLLKEPDMQFEILHIKDLTRRKNLKEVRGRIIGTHGKTKETMEEISSCKIIQKDNEVGILGLTESVENAKTALTSLIKGSKQANVYRYLEKMNKKNNDEGLGLKEKEE